MLRIVLHLRHVGVAFQAGFMTRVLRGVRGNFLQGIAPEPAVLVERRWDQKVVGDEIGGYDGDGKPGEACHLRRKESFHGILISLRSESTSMDNDIYLLHIGAFCKYKRQTYLFIFLGRLFGPFWPLQEGVHPLMKINGKGRSVRRGVVLVGMARQCAIPLESTQVLMVDDALVRLDLINVEIDQVG